MIKINKGKEPAEWILERTTPGMTYEDAKKDVLRLALLEEQGGLCAYCMRRISFTTGKTTSTRIEHVKPQALSIAEGKSWETLSYGNMVLCCDGDIDGNGTFHCDRSKEDRIISFKPFDQTVMDTISYSSNKGTIKSSNKDYDRDFNKILNLNHPKLEISRLAVIKGLVTELGRKKIWKKRDLIDKLNYYSTPKANGKFHEYCGVIIWYLNKKIRQIG